MGSKGSWLGAACLMALAGGALGGCSGSTSEPSAGEQRATYLSRVREVYQLGRREGLSLQRQKIDQGVAPAYATPSESECAARWEQLGQGEKTLGDKNSFVSLCSSFPTPGMPGYDDAVAEAAGKRP
ncbi:hypothetical protein ACFWXK_14360 [Streptomyces sp. NPDC059070]|uniref:hypothetical protein n=1 Tax=Streptomyces sp. NPDC059070 TaxID=3346713 RepID=UPI0036A78CEF